MSGGQDFIRKSQIHLTISKLFYKDFFIQNSKKNIMKQLYDFTLNVIMIN